MAVIRTNDALANKRQDMTFNSSAGINFDSATVKFYDGTMAATADTAIGAQVLIATSVLAADAFANSASRGVVANAIASVNAVAAGTITWARIQSGIYTIDVDVTLNAGTGALKVDNATLTVGQQLNITSLSAAE